MRNLIYKLKCLKADLAAFIENEKAVASVEFAFIAPLMVATYFGSVEISRAYIAKNRVETVSETVSDLVAQGKNITEAELTDIFAISSKILRADEEAKFNVVVTAVRTLPDAGGDPETKVTWSESKTGEHTRTVGDTFTELPDGIAQNYETVIVTELYYKHNSILEFFVKGDKIFDRRFIHKPRYSSDIPCTDC